MPLAFETKSHGTIAVGFFNVESDMFLVGHYFLFASDLCGWISSWAAEAPEAFTEPRPAYTIRDRRLQGNLHGATQGWDLSGFIGAVYRRFPFPERREQFRQQTRGYETRDVMEALVQEYSHGEEVLMKAEPDSLTFSFGDFVFSRSSWNAVLDYIWRGGMPRWSEEGPPGYVREMRAATARSSHWLFGDWGVS